MPSPRSSWKFLYGRSFRNPSAYELFFDDQGLSALGNPGARPEKGQTYEVVVEQKLTKTFGASAAAYHYRLHDLLVGVRTADGLLQYQNVDSNRASGLELEASGRLAPWMEAVAGFAIQRAIDDRTRWTLVNSPQRIGHLRLAVPLFSNRWSLSGGLRYMSTRKTMAGNLVGSVVLPECTVTSTHLLPGVDL